MTIHKKIKNARLKLGMSEQQFADAVGVTRGSVQQWERENGTAPNRKRQPAVAALLGVSVSELMAGKNDAPDLAQSSLSYWALDLAKMLDSIKSEKEKRMMHAQCILILTKNPILQQLMNSAQTQKPGQPPK